MVIVRLEEQGKDIVVLLRALHDRMLHGSAVRVHDRLDAQHVQHSGRKVDAGDQRVADGTGGDPPRPAHDVGALGAVEIAVRLGVGQGHAVVAQEQHQGIVTIAHVVQRLQDLAHDLVAAVNAGEVLCQLLPHVRQVGETAGHRDLLRRVNTVGSSMMPEIEHFIISAHIGTVGIMGVGHQEEGLALLPGTGQELLDLVVIHLR